MRVMQMGWIRSTGLYEDLLREAIAEKVIEESATIQGETFYKLPDPELVF